MRVVVEVVVVVQYRGRRGGAPRVPVREVPETPDLGGRVVAARHVGHDAAVARRRRERGVRRVRREAPLRVRVRVRRGCGALALRLGQEVEPLVVVVGVRHRRADDVAEGLRRVALLGRGGRGGLLAPVAQHEDAGYEQRDPEQAAHDAAYDGRGVERVGGRRRWCRG